jgi:hypothetical protein
MPPPIWHSHDFILCCVQREEAGKGPCPFSKSTTEAIAQQALNVADAPRVPWPGPAAQLTGEIQVRLLPRSHRWSMVLNGPSSVKASTDRANATLAVEQPTSSSWQCCRTIKMEAAAYRPRAQSLVADRRCLPNGFIAKIAEKLAPASSIRVATVSPSVGGELPVDNRTARRRACRPPTRRYR